MGDVGSVHPLAVLKRYNVRLRLTVENAPVVGTGLHHQGEGRKLGRPVVNLQLGWLLSGNQIGEVLQLKRGLTLKKVAIESLVWN